MRHTAIATLSFAGLLALGAAPFVVSPVSAFARGKGPRRETTQEPSGSASTDAALGSMGGAPLPPPKAKLPVTLTLSAPTPDPAWSFRVENTGEHPIRIAADARILSFDLETKSGARFKCSAPAALRPSRLTDDRALYLQPGEAFVESFDPRLYCFGDATDALTDGTVVHPHYGFSSNAWAKKGPYAAEGIDKPYEFTPLTQIDGAAVTLAYAKVAPRPGRDGQKSNDDKALQPAPAVPSPVPSADDKPHKIAFVDRNKPQIEVLVDRFSDAGAARDIVVTIRASNGGGRDLITAMRGRMLSFTVAQLKPDNTADKVVDCPGSDGVHAIAAEMFQKVDAGQAVAVPLLLAEICPKGTFDRPGLYSVLPRIDTSVEGEGIKLDAFIGQALARQSILVRLGSATSPFDQPAPAVFAPPTNGPSSSGFWVEPAPTK